MKSIILLILITLGLSAASLKSIVKEGLELDPRINQLVKAYSIALKDLELVEGNYRPTLDVSGFGGRERTTTPANLGASTLYSASSAQAIAGYNLFAGFEDMYLIKEKETAVKLAENRLEEGIISVSAEISNAYLNMIKRHKIYLKQQENIRSYERTLKKVSLKIKDGGGRDSDLFQTRSRKNFAETNLLIAKQDYQDAQIELGQFIARMPSISGMYDPKVSTNYMRLNRLVSTAKKRNATLNNFRLQKEISAFIMEQQKANYYPTVDLEVSKNWAKELHGIIGIDDNERIGLNLKYNLYNGGKDAINVERAKLQILKDKDSIAEAERSVVTTVKRTFNSYMMYRKRVNAIDIHIKNAKKTEILYMKEEEETGERSIIDILNIQQEYNSAQIARIDAKYNSLQLYFSLLSSTSEILDYLAISKR